jgi:hypothetical protein
MDRMISHIRFPMALAALLLLGGSQCPQAAPGTGCVSAVNRGFAGVASAALHTLEACFARPGEAADAIATCLARDAAGWIERARARTERVEAFACQGAPPAFGYTSAAEANAAAEQSVAELARGLFGRDLDAARADGASDARCQRRVLSAAGRCAESYTDAYQRCASGALRTGADDPFDLVACKGEDPQGALERACGSGVAAALASCQGDLAALFPGCAGDVAACAQGYARKSASDAINAAGALCGDVLPGTLSEPALLQCFAPPPPEPIAWSEVPLPEGVSPLTVEWQESGEEMIVSFTAPDVTGTQLASVRADGGDFRCLTCGSAIAGNLRPVQRFADGRRVLVAGNNNAVPRWNVLECAPSLLDCQTSQLVPIQPPPNPDRSTPILQYRVPWVTLDDAWLVWSEVRIRGPGGNVSAMGRLVRDATRYVVQDARVIAPPVRSLDLGTDSALWRNFTQPFEAKYGALRGGRDWVEAGTPTAGQYDTSVIDLVTGEMRRLTRHPDHDEGIRFSRDERWSVLQSARSDGRVEFLGLLPRPPYIDWIAFSVHFVAIAGAPNDGISPGSDPKERDCYVDPWLLDQWFERGDYIGQRLLAPTEDGWVSIEGNAGGFGWSPDGTKIALIERKWRYEPPQARLRIASLTSRDPVPPAQWVPVVATPEPTWAMRYEDYRVPNTAGVTVIPGAVSGTAAIRNDMANATQGEIEVVYDDYSDDGLHVLDGSELLRIPALVLEGAEYEVDLTLSGAHTGSMRGAIGYDFLNDVNTGEVVSELDGRVATGPKTCYEAGLIPIP